jgi:hypothetical protein
MSCSKCLAPKSWAVKSSAGLKSEASSIQLVCVHKWCFSSEDGSCAIMIYVSVTKPRTAATCEGSDFNKWILRGILTRNVFHTFTYMCHHHHHHHHHHHRRHNACLLVQCKQQSQTPAEGYSQRTLPAV